MKVFHINGNYVTTALHQIMIEHLDKFTENIVFCPISNGCVTTVNPNDNVVVSRCYSKIDRLLYFRKQRLLRQEIFKLCNVDDVDIIHAYTLLSDGGAAMWLSKRIGKPYVVAIRSTDINDFFKLKPYLIPYGVKIMEKASAVFFLSDAYMNLMFDKFIPGKKKDSILRKSFVIPNGIDDFWLDNVYTCRDFEKIEETFSEKRINLLSVAQILKWKNIPAVQKAADILKIRGYDVHIDVVGKIKDEDEFNIVKAHNLTTCHEPRPKEDLVKFYRNNDIFVLPSHTETFGLVYAEAMTQSMPVIYTKGQGFDGQFPEGAVGYHCDDYNPETIADAVEKIIGSYKTIAGNCVFHAEKFRWESICQKYVEIYKSILGEK